MKAFYLIVAAALLSHAHLARATLFPTVTDPAILGGLNFALGFISCKSGTGVKLTAVGSAKLSLDPANPGITISATLAVFVDGQWQDITCSIFVGYKFPLYFVKKYGCDKILEIYEAAGIAFA